MKNSANSKGILAIAVLVSSLSALSAFADSRHQNETWRSGDDRGRYDRDSRRQDDRDLLRGVVERVDRRRDTVVLRTGPGGRVVTVAMVRRGNRGGIDVEDLRRGDRVTFAGDWSRQGVFRAWRINDVDSRNGRRR